MAPSQPSREQQVRSIVEALSTDLGSTTPRAVIEREADRVYAELERDSRVEAFIPILAYRRTRAHLARTG